MMHNCDRKNTVMVMILINPLCVLYLMKRDMYACLCRSVCYHVAEVLRTRTCVSAVTF